MVKINAALCSFGMSGWVFHAPFLHLHDGYNLYAVWERSQKLAHEKYPAIISYDNYEDLLQDKNVDLVIVNTPNYTHYSYAKLAIQAGKHVIVEKPFVINSVEGQELISIAETNNVKLSVYQNRRWDSDFLTIKNIVQQKKLGVIVEFESHFDRYSEALSYKLHKETPGNGTGNLYDLGSHLIDQALHLFGLPNAVFADIGIVRDISNVDDYFELLLFYENLRVRIHSTYLAKEQPIGYILHGTKGSFIKPKTNVQEVALVNLLQPNSANWGEEEVKDWGLLHTNLNGQEIKEFIPTIAGDYMQYYNEVYESIINNKTLPVTASQALNVIKIIELAYKSNHEKRVVEFSTL